MYNLLASSFGSGFSVNPGFFTPRTIFFFVVLLIWVSFWKGLALWHAGRRGHVIWFLVALFVNTVGIVEIIYLFAVLKLKTGDLFTGRSKPVEHPSTQ